VEALLSPSRIGIRCEQQATLKKSFVEVAPARSEKPRWLVRREYFASPSNKIVL